MVKIVFVLFVCLVGWLLFYLFVFLFCFLFCFLFDCVFFERDVNQIIQIIDINVFKIILKQIITSKNVIVFLPLHIVITPYLFTFGEKS